MRDHRSRNLLMSTDTLGSALGGGHGEGRLKCAVDDCLDYGAIRGANAVGMGGNAQRKEGRRHCDDAGTRIEGREVVVTTCCRWV